MDSILKTIRINDLLNIYSSQLSETQREILENYFVYDLSMSEIAEDRQVSRAAVEDAIKKGSKKLESLESELHLLEKREALLKAAKTIKENTNDEKIVSIANDIERIIN